MNERPIDNVIDRVRKLLAKTAAKGCTRAEAEAAFQAASRIMAEYNLDLAEVAVEDNTTDNAWTEEEVYQTGRWTLEIQLAVEIVMEFFFVEALVVTDWNVGGRRRKVLRFFGRPENVQTATRAFDALIYAFDSLFREYRRRTRRPASDRRTFVAGVASGFTQKLQDELDAMEIERDLQQGKSSGSTALAIQSVAEQTRQALREHHGDTFNENGEPRGRRSSFAALTGSSFTFEAGQYAGRSLDLSLAPSGSRHKRDLAE